MPSLRSALVLALVLGACASGDGSATTTTPGTDTSVTTTTTTPSTTTTTTTTVPSTTTTTTDPNVLPDTAPATWVGVTTDYEAVEVDTATGEVIRSLGQVSTAEDVEDAECAACVNAIDAVWRTFDGAHTIISECCEPAAGMIHVLADDELPLGSDSERDPVFFWWASPSPDSSLVAFLGYGVAVAPADDPHTPVASAELDDFPVSNAVWDPDGETVRWLEDAAGTLRLRSFEIANGTSTAVAVTGVDPSGVAGLAATPSGEMIAVFAGEDAATTALVLGLGGEITDEFDLDTGARPGGYDPSGTLLIYTDDDGSVHWLSDTGTGILAEGFIQASW